MVGKVACGVVAVLCLAACGKSTRDDGHPATAGEGGAPISTAGAGGAGPGAIEQIQACGLEEPCEASGAQWIDGTMRVPNEELARCVLRALYYRSPGKYVHVTSESSGSRLRADNYVIAISESPWVSLAELRNDSSIDGSSSVESGARCRLAAPSYFKACLDALDAGDEGATWACLYGDEGRVAWFADCVNEEQLSCEAPSCGTSSTECCEEEPEPCAGLSEAECELRDECSAIRGVPFAGDTEWEPEAATFIGCRSACRGGGGEAVSCTFAPARPEECFLIGTTAGPDGWEEDFECSEQCGGL